MSSEARIETEPVELEERIAELERRAAGDDRFEQEIGALRERLRVLQAQTLPDDVWKRVELARHLDRPYTLDYARMVFEDFSEISGDRRFGDDPAIVCGMARFQGEPVLLVGHQKGRDTKERLRRNFGQPKPEGYRKALRAMRLAAKFRRPIFCLIDTQGAYPGVDAEARGQAEAIANNLREMARLPVPILVTITGEGGSGGALAVAIGDKVSILENAFYSVISPEGCASIMWRDASKKELAARALRLTAPDLLKFGVVDEIIPEPPGGAHTDPEGMAKILGSALARSLDDFRAWPVEDLLQRRYEKFRRMGQFFDEIE